MRAGRKVKTHTTADGEHIAGLSRQADGRWRVLLEGKETRFSESDERRAVDRAKAILGLDQAKTTIIEVSLADMLSDAPSNIDQITGQHADRLTSIFDASPELNDDTQFTEGEMQDAKFKLPIADAILWPWLRRILLKEPEYVAKMTGIQELAGLRSFNIPSDSVRVSEIVRYYEDHNASTPPTKASVKRIWTKFVSHTEAKTLRDLTKNKIHAYRQSVETDSSIKSAGTRKWMYGQIKSIISFSLKNPALDASDIRQCLDRCELLWTAEASPEVQPKPIARDVLHKLLASATPIWRAWLLLGLNAAMYIAELSALEWSHVDLEAGTLRMVRTKTKRKRIPRAATLWPETVAAIRALPKGPKYVFTSRTGTRYVNSQSRANDFAELRQKAGVGDQVSFSHLRDGAFTAACRCTDVRLAKILSGHAAGMEDHYVLRNPEIVKPACDAVYETYGPF